MPAYLVLPKPDAIPPIKASEPKSFADYEFYPAVQFRASETTIASLAKVLRRRDASGDCLVAHMKVNGTAVFLYQAEDHADADWLVYVDIRESRKQGQRPTQVGKTVAKYFTSEPAAWVNTALDALAKRRASAESVAESLAAKKMAKPATKKLSATKGGARPWRPAKAGSPAVRAAAAKLPFAAPAKKAAAKKPAAKKPAAKKPAA